MDKTISRVEAVELLANHNWTPTEQTAMQYGKLVESGTSFDENLGVKEVYKVKDVFAWLGY